jgi:hypothetical protein
MLEPTLFASVRPNQIRTVSPAPPALSTVPSSVTNVLEVLSNVITVAVTERTRAHPLFTIVSPDA